MMRYCRLSLAVCFLTILTVIGLPGSLQAAQKPNLSLEEAINLVKENFSIPEEYKEFSSNYEANYGQAAWVLSWRAAGAPYGEFNAQVDAKKSIITRVNNWGQDSNTYTSPISRAQAKDSAAQLLERLLPDRIDELQWVADDELISPLESSGTSVYTLRWQRVHQGIPFPENGATFQVRSGDGRILEYSLTWTNGDLPSPSGIISADQARQVFEGSSLLELQYFQPDYVKPGFSYQKNPVLVYRVGAHGSVAIDAFSGQPVKYWVNNEIAYDMAGGMGGREKSATQSSLSPEEQQEVSSSSQVISSEQAVQAVKKWFNIPADLSLTQSNLVSQGSGASKMHVWNLNWQNEASQGSGYVNARVNARNGEVISYSRDWSQQAGKAILSNEEARQAAEAFLKQIQPGRFPETAYEEPQGLQIYPRGDSLRYFNYYRVVNDLPFPGNYLNLTINAQDKTIVAYELNWTEASFPSSAGVLNKQDISSRFLKDRPLTLSYAIRQDPGKSVPTGQEQIGLVYKPLYGAYATRADQLDAISGLPLDWQGNPIVVKRAFFFDDIEGDPAWADINAVGRAGLFGEYGTSFHPEEGLTMQSLLTNLIKARDPYLDPKPDDIIREARSRGWIKEQVQLEQLVDRENMARIMVRFTGLDRAAQAKGIYTLPYPDAQDISADFYGYVALAYGLDMVKGGADAYESGHIVTRAEAASSLVKAMKSN
ncbi:MAG: YcdB/YcdC domain-containing protein [Syntrophomonadaceae bacterium]